MAYDGTVPIGRNGEMLAWPESWSERIPDAEPGAWPSHRRVEPELQPLLPFDAILRLVDYERGQSAVRFIFEDTNTGKRYPMFLAEAFKLVVSKEVSGIWGPVKRGQNYGIERVAPVSARPSWP